jgi:hypothetical protein
LVREGGGGAVSTVSEYAFNARTSMFVVSSCGSERYVERVSITEGDIVLMRCVSVDSGRGVVYLL